MKQEGYGRGYAYDHNEDEAFSGQNYFPDGMERQTFYAPTTYGYEAEVKERLKRLAKLRESETWRRIRLLSLAIWRRPHERALHLD